MTNLALLLARRKRDYPYGIPLYVSKKEKVLFVYDNSGADILQFLKSLTENGLKMRFEEQLHLLINADLPKEKINLHLKFQSESLKFIIVFGNHLIQQVSYSGSDLIIAESIEKLKESQELKKALWNEIKARL